MSARNAIDSNYGELETLREKLMDPYSQMDLEGVFCMLLTACDLPLYKRAFSPAQNACAR